MRSMSEKLDAFILACIMDVVVINDKNEELMITMKM